MIHMVKKNVFNNDGVKNILGISFDTHRNFEVFCSVEKHVTHLNYALLD